MTVRFVSVPVVIVCTVLIVDNGSDLQHSQSRAGR